MYTRDTSGVLNTCKERREGGWEMGGGTHFAKRPHQRAVHAHQLLVIDHVGLVQHDPDLVLIA